MPSVLFIHNGSPGRFAFLAQALAGRGWKRALINGPVGTDLPGVPTLRWQEAGALPISPAPLFRPTETALANGRAAAAAARHLKESGFTPDIIVGHPGWGEMLFLDQVFPACPQLQLGELYYHTRHSDVDFDPEFSVLDFDRQLNIRAMNLHLATNYAHAARIVSPTHYQAGLLPAAFRSQVRVIHEGIDTSIARRMSPISLRLANGKSLDGSFPVVTFANRFFEPMRGFHRMMRALPHLLDTLPDVQVIMIGSEERGGYGLAAPVGTTWKQFMLQELDGRLDLSRVHFVGQLPYAQLLKVLSASWAHVYLTYPFVLSWSLLDAMACECLVVGSDTAPVREVIEHDRNGLLVDFFDTDRLSRVLVDACRAPLRYAPMRRAARKTILEKYDRKSVCEPAWLGLIDEVVGAP